MYLSQQGFLFVSCGQFRFYLHSWHTLSSKLNIKSLYGNKQQMKYSEILLLGILN